MRRILTIALAVGLSACASGQFAMFGARHKPAPAPAIAQVPAPPPLPADGLWAILDRGCPKPSVANIRAWPKCASPFWISRGRALVVRSAGGRTSGLLDASYAADYRIDGGDPVIAQVGSQKDGYLFLALTNLAKDDQGRLVGATGAAVACPKEIGGGVAIRPNLNGCETEPLDRVRKAAAATLQDRTALTEIAWIATGAP